MQTGKSQTPPSQHVDADLSKRNSELVTQIEKLSQAFQRVEAMSQLTPGVVHDVRNSLTVVLGEAELLVSSLLEPDVLESAMAVQLAGTHANAILTDLLSFARNVEVQESLVNSAELIDNCRPLIQRIAQKNLECEFVVEQGVWPVAVDAYQLEAALINLSANARDATPSGGRIRISVRNLPIGTPLPSTLPPGEYVGFSVQDWGSGMTPDVIKRATEAFYTTKDVDSGTGLGLSMVDAFSTRYGGSLEIESAPDLGTRVEILLPRAIPPQEPVEDTSRHAMFQKIRRRVRTEWLRDILEGWRFACPVDGLPRPVHVEAALVGHDDFALVLAVEPETEPPTFRLKRMGNALVKSLESVAMGELPIGGMMSGRQGEAYQRVLRSRFPAYEYARFSFGDGSPVEFERMILPASSGGEAVTHLISVVVLSPTPDPGNRHD